MHFASLKTNLGVKCGKQTFRNHVVLKFVDGVMFHEKLGTIGKISSHMRISHLTTLKRYNRTASLVVKNR